MAAPSISTELRELHSTALTRMQQNFERTYQGRLAVEERTELVDRIAVRLWKEFVCPDREGPEGFVLVAIGGYGRSMLFPQSDVDILFLHEDSRREKQFRDQTRQFSQELWDLRLKLSPQTRTLAECERLDPNNLEFTISLLDCRHLGGDQELFSRLRDSVVPQLAMRESRLIVDKLAEVTEARHRKFGNTIFHLEPNIKDGPGGLRDYNVVHWLSLVSGLEKLQEYSPEHSLISPAMRKQFDAAMDHLVSVRCFLHFRHGRDDNTLTWEAQAEAAAQGIGILASEGLRPTSLNGSSGTEEALPWAKAMTPEDWMRVYFRHARSIQRVAIQLLEEIPASRSSLYREFQNWRSRLSNSNFSVVNGFILLQQAGGVTDPELLLDMFHFMAQHGLKLGTATEQRIEHSLGTIASHVPKPSSLWNHFREILRAPHAAEALRAMHDLKLLNLFIPELAAIDSLVVRDYYHRFTVDEHSFLTIDNLHRLQKPQSGWEQRYGELLSELEQPELLFLALLLHDVGKGTAWTDHVQGSLDTAWRCLSRWELSPADRDTVYFLIANHLEMSSVLRRDIFDPATIRALADKMGTPERLKMLCLMTYADIKSVNPDALTPWKAENIWQVYIAASNELNRSVDRERVEADAEDEYQARVRSLAPALGKKLKSFLDGLPQRYLRVYPAETVLLHVEMANALGADPVQLDLRRGRHWFELTLVTEDRPALFSQIAGALSAWGMNIVKASAFSNRSGVVVDTFYFTDRFRTLELNLPEWERFKRSVSQVLSGEADLERLMRERMRSEKAGPAKVKVDTKIEFDDDSSSHSTVVEVIAQDRPGLLHQISSTFASQKCNIEVGLIDTEGQMAIDVFYLTFNGEKLRRSQQETLRRALLENLSEA